MYETGSPMAPLQCLPQQPLTSPTGARLVLCNRDAGYPGRSSPGRGRWFDNITDTDTKTFLRAINHLGDGENFCYFSSWKWPAVVLMPEEYKLRVGGMSVTGLRSLLEKYWGRGGIPSAAAPEAGYQDMWVPAWAPDNIDDPYDLQWCVDSGDEAPRLSPAIFSHWVNGECTKWISYFIANNHTLGVVHAWFTAFLGATRAILVDIAELTDKAEIPHLKTCMSFDVCIEAHNPVVDGLPSLPLDIKITTHSQGMQVIDSSINEMFPRRVWDICANTVIPETWFCDPRPHLALRVGVRPVSHAWVADLSLVVTEANQQLWPVPLPSGVQLEDVRGEMIRLGVRYAWLDVLCLRQQAQPALAKDLIIPFSREVVERLEQRRLEEWKVDVPTIGAVYSNQHEMSIYGEGPTIIFMSGLGRPFRPEGWASERHWLKRTWTIQEAPVLSRCLIAGLPNGANYHSNGSTNSGSLWPWNCKVCDVLSKIHRTELKTRARYKLPSRLMMMVSSFTLP